MTPLPPLEGWTRKAATWALSLATFMNVLDTTIANVSIPAIAGDLGVSPTEGTWVITSFAVANAITVPLTGWLTERFGQVRLFVISILLFTLASFLCGMAASMPMLVAFRVLQGAVAGPMIPLSQALLLSIYPKARAGTALAAWSITTLVAPVLGPILGGWLTDNLTWPWIFFINLPVGLLAAWLTWQLLKARETPTHARPIDSIGLFLLVLWVGALQVMLDRGRELDWFESPQIVALGLTALIGFCVFLVWELSNDHPVVDLSLFRRLNFSVGTIAIAVAYCLFFGNVVIVPLWLQTILGYTATWAGLVTAPLGVLAIIMTPIVAKILPKLGPRLVVSASFLIFALTYHMRSLFATTADVETIILPQLIQGAAMASFFVPLVAIILAGLPPQRIPSAMGLSNFVRMVAGAFGASLFTTMWDHRTSLHHAQLVEHLDPSGPVLNHTLSVLESRGLDHRQALAWVERELTRQASTLSADDLFYLSSFLVLGLVALVWLTHPGKAEARAAAAD